MMVGAGTNTSPDMAQVRVSASSPWLRVGQAAEHAGVSKDTIYAACNRGELAHVRIGGKRTIRLRVEWVDAWLERHARAVC